MPIFDNFLSNYFENKPQSHVFQYLEAVVKWYFEGIQQIRPPQYSAVSILEL